MTPYQIRRDNSQSYDFMTDYFSDRKLFLVLLFWSRWSLLSLTTRLKSSDDSRQHGFQLSYLSPTVDIMLCLPL